MIGQKFGMLTVIKDSGKRTNDRGIIWLCKCDCGKAKEVSSKLLRNEKKPRSCGCSRKLRAELQFYSHIDKSTDCWNWTGTLTTGGYGKFRSYPASRIMWEYEYGKIPKGLQVLHTCDNRKCVNPSHLFLGTISDNMADKVAKKRQAKGSKIGNAILNEDTVYQIRKLRLEGKSYHELMKVFGLSFQSVRGICKNSQWKHVALGEECAKYVSPHDRNQVQHNIF